jgi:hypothetical protein
MADEKLDEHEGEDVRISQGASGAFPTGIDMVGPGTVRQGSGYSGSTSGDVEPGTGHDPSPYDPPAEGYMGDTTSSDEPAEEVIQIEGDSGP